MKKLLNIILSIILISMPVFAKSPTNLQHRQLETAVYNTANFEQVMSAVVSTLQDSDFIIEEYEPELGHIKATKLFKQRYINKARFAGQSVLLAAAASYAVFTWGSTAAYTYKPARRITDELHAKNVIVDTNVNVEKFGEDKTRVRIVLVQKILQNAEGFSYTKQAPLRAFRIKDTNVYQEFFNQVWVKLEKDS